MADEAFQAEFGRLLRDYAGTPSLLYRRRPALRAGRRADPAQARGPQPHRRAQGAQRARPGAAHQADGQAAGDRRDRRRPARRGHAPPPPRCSASSAWSTWARRTPERQALNVARMRMLGATVVPVTTGSRTLKDAINEALRDWVTNVDDTHYLLGTAAGPHPFPAMVRDFVRGIGVEARAAVPGPDRRAAGRGRAPASAAAPTRSASSTPSSPRRRRAAVRLRGRRRRRRAPAGTRPASPAARSACCTAPGPTCCRTRTARPSSRTRSRPAWTTRASGPEHAWLHDTGRATLRAGDRRRGDGGVRSCSAAPRASSRRSRARTRSPARCGSSRSSPPSWAASRSSWSTCPAAATRTWTPPATYFGVLDKEQSR